MNFHYEADSGRGKGKRQEYELHHALRKERDVALDLHGLEWFSSLKRKPFFAKPLSTFILFYSAMTSFEMLYGLYDLKWSI